MFRTAHTFAVAKEKGMFFVLQIIQVTQVTMAIVLRLPTSSFNSQGVSTKPTSGDIPLYSPAQIKIEIFRHLVWANSSMQRAQRRSKLTMIGGLLMTVPSWLSIF